jgi:hypothetical protein
MRKCANISPFMRRPLVIYDFVTMVTVDKKTRYKVPYQIRKGNVAWNKVVSVEN